MGYTDGISRGRGFVDLQRRGEVLEAMSNESLILTLLSIIGCLLGALVIYFVMDVQNKFKDIQTWITNLSTKLDTHINNCKNGGF
jgi:hypothetical protein